MDIQYFRPDQVDKVDPVQWDRLSAESLHINPFYERWNLTPALKYLIQDDEDVLIVVVTDEGQWVGLFPVVIKHYFNRVKYLSMWKHFHCFLTDPLLKKSYSFRSITTKITKHFAASWFEVTCHTAGLINPGLGVRQRMFSRAAVFSDIIENDKEKSLKGKVRRENRRILKRLQENFSVRHLEHNNCGEALQRFAIMENTGWKGKQGTSMMQRPGVMRYYQALISRCNEREALFHELWADDVLIAITLRLWSREHFFDIKTTFNEEYRSYAPGVAIELLNLLQLKDQQFVLLDSCTNEDNHLINKLWPHQRQLFYTLVFPRSMRSAFWYFSRILKGYFDTRRIGYR